MILAILLSVIIIALIIVILVSQSSKKKLNADYLLSKAELNSKSGKIEELSNKLEKEKNRFEKESKELESTRADLSEAKALISKHQKEINRLNEERDKVLERLKAEKENGILNVEAEREKGNEKIAALTKAADATQQRLQDQIKLLETTNQSLKKHISSNEATIKAQLLDQKTIQEQLDTSNKENGRLSELITSKECTINKLQENINLLEENNHQLQKNNEQLQENISQLEEDKNQLKENNCQIQNDCNRLQESIHQQNEAIGQLQSKELELQKKIETLTKENQAKEGSISVLNQELNDANAKAAEKDHLLEQVNTELAASQDLTAHLNSVIDELKLLNTDLKAQIDEAPDADELERTIEQLQQANEALSQTKNELENLNSLFETRGETIIKLQHALDKAWNEIARLNEEIEALKEQIKLLTEDEEVVNDDDLEEDENNSDHEENNEEPNKEEEDLTPHKGNIFQNGHSPSNQQDESNGSDDDDLPIIENDKGEVQRTILGVNDLESANPEAFISAEEFFNREPSEIALKSRYLAEANKMGRDAFVCACCKHRVKISKRDYGTHEILFFAHCEKNVDCAWRKEASDSMGISTSDEELDENALARFRTIKSLFVKSLCSQESYEKGIYGVEEDAIIHSDYSFMHWRKAPIHAYYNDKEIVFEFYTRHTLLNKITDRDLFYRLNNQHVIWIFGADQESGYDYIKKHVPQNIMFTNHRNAFIVDHESIAACETRQELVLKCNYLDSSDRWHYRKDTTSSNGILITLDQLQFDEELGKLYYYDANQEYFALHPRSEANYLNSIRKKEDIIRDLMAKYVKEKVETHLGSSPTTDIVKTNRPANNPSRSIDPSKPIIKHIPGKDNRYYYFLNGKCGVVDEDSNFIIPCEYSQINLWSKDKYRVQKIDLWGIFDVKKGLVLDTCYRSIGNLVDDKALVDAGKEQFFINRDCKRFVDEKYQLHNGWIKYRCGKKWGIVDANRVEIVKCEYDEIGSFRGRLIGFINGSFQKLTQRFNYKIKMQCRCIKNKNGHAIFSINGVQLYGVEKKICKDGAVYSDKCICNILYQSGQIFVNNLTPKNVDKQFNTITNEDNDFDVGNTYVGRIIRTRKNGNRTLYIVKLDNEKQSYFTSGTIRTAGQNPNNFTIGTEVSLTKIGYDKDYDKTLWKLN